MISQNYTPCYADFLPEKKKLWKNEASANKKCCQSSTFEVFWKKSFCNSFHGSDHCLCSFVRCTNIFNLPKSPRNESTRLQHNSLLWELNVDLRKIYRKLNWWRNHNKFKITSILDILDIISGNDILEWFYIFQAGGGNVKIESRKLEWNAAPRTKMVNENYKGPTGGDKKVEKIQKKQNDLMYKQKKTHKKTQTDK